MDRFYEEIYYKKLRGDSTIDDRIFSTEERSVLSGLISEFKFEMKCEKETELCSVGKFLLLVASA